MTKYIDNITVNLPGWSTRSTVTLANLYPVTIILGRNGSCKSTILRALRDLDPASFHYIAPERVGSIKSSPGLVQQQETPHGRRDTSMENSPAKYRDNVVARLTSLYNVRGANLKETSPSDLIFIQDSINELMPGFAFKIAPGNPPYLLTKDNGEEVGGHQHLSSGECQMFILALDVATIGAIWDTEDNPKRILLFDEPDVHLHPELQVRFAFFLISVAKRFKLQLIIATHSTTLLSSLGKASSECGVLFLNHTNTSFEARKYSDHLQGVSDVLGGHALMGPLFGTPILIVEGDDDYRIWTRAARGSSLNLCVINAGNSDKVKRAQLNLERIFSSLYSETTLLGHALLDGDQTKPEANPDNPQNFIPFLRLQCQEAENLYLSDEVLESLGVTWDEASTQLAECQDCGEKGAVLNTAKSWDRKSQDVKTMIHEIARILDNKNVHWTERVGALLGRQPPTGQLREFLGEETVETLWTGPSQDSDDIAA